MMTDNRTSQMPQDEKAKVAYALNLCAVSISQIIDSRDLIVLKQERESILSNLNLQNFVKHPALLDVLKRILDTVTYLELQAGDLSFVEKEYQHRLKNAIWQAVPSPAAFIAGGTPVSIAIAIVAQIGTGYMNYRRNKSQYALDKDRSEWELKRHELEQLYGLRAQLFETAWQLSSDYNFDDKFRLTEKQLCRYSEALLEQDPLKRFERLDVMSDKFQAFPPFWYHKGNAAMGVYRDEKRGHISDGFRSEAMNAYEEFRRRHVAFLREDITAASCYLEYASLAVSDAANDPKNRFVEELLRDAVAAAGDNYDVLQQSVLMNIKLKKFDDVIRPLREMIVNDYNVGVNGKLLSRIYFEKSRRAEYDRLCAIVGPDNVAAWSNEGAASEQHTLSKQKMMLSQAYRAMNRRIAQKIIMHKSRELGADILKKCDAISDSLLKYCKNGSKLKKSLDGVRAALRAALAAASPKTIDAFTDASEQVCEELRAADFSLQFADEAACILVKINEAAK